MRPGTSTATATAIDGVTIGTTIYDIHFQTLTNWDTAALQAAPQAPLYFTDSIAKELNTDLNQSGALYVEDTAAGGETSLYFSVLQDNATMFYGFTETDPPESGNWNQIYPAFLDQIAVFTPVPEPGSIVLYCSLLILSICLIGLRRKFKGQIHIA